DSPFRCPEYFGGLDRLLRDRREAGEQNDEREGRPIPYFEHRDGRERDVRIAQPCRLEIDTDNPRDDVIERAALVEDHLGCISDDDGDGEHRQYEYDVIERLTAKRLVHEVGEQKAEYETAQRNLGSVSTSRNRSRPTNSASHHEPRYTVH